jgi:hypothetical protein
MTNPVPLWDPEQDRMAAFNAKHGHAPDCVFVIDDWVCAERCEKAVSSRPDPLRE